MVLENDNLRKQPNRDIDNRSMSDSGSETDDGEAFDLTNDLTGPFNGNNSGSSSTTRSPSTGSTTRTPTPTTTEKDTDILSFFQETGLSEDMLEQLGIDLEEIKAQRQLEKRTEQNRHDQQLAHQLGYELNNASTSSRGNPQGRSSISQPQQQQSHSQPQFSIQGIFPMSQQVYTYPPPSQQQGTVSNAELAQRMASFNLRQLPSSFNTMQPPPPHHIQRQTKRPKLEPSAAQSVPLSSSVPPPAPLSNQSSTVIELSDGDDDDDDCVDLTADSPPNVRVSYQLNQPTPHIFGLHSQSPIPRSYNGITNPPMIPPMQTPNFQPYQSYNAGSSSSSAATGYVLSLDSDEYESDDERIYNLDADDIENPYANMAGNYPYNSSQRLPVGQNGDLPFDSERYDVPYNRFVRPMNAENTEKELKALLENIQYDDVLLPEDRTGTPDRLKITLMEHQKVGLQWLTRMEESSNRGGILSDDMGLGKTVQAMALIVSRPCTNATPIRHLPMMRRGKRRASEEFIKTKATLVICPVSLAAQWERELLTKTQPPLNVYIYHGSQRISDETILAGFDVIITTYTLVSIEFVEDEAQRGPLGRMKFHRVILDEAHTIKNYRTSMANACNRIDASYRWCMTATPIQNRIEELYSLIKFLRIRPYCEWDEFRDQIKKPLDKGLQEHAIKKVQALLKAISLRRSKKAKIDGRPILKLPERNIHFTHVDFTPDERNFYDFVNKRSQAQFNKYMRQGTVMKNYSSVLVLLLRLRQACLHPKLTMLERGEEEEVDEDAQQDLAVAMNMTVVNRLLHDDTDFSQIECPICMDMADQAQIIPGCGHMLCRECLFNYLNTNEMRGEKRCPQCRGPLQGDKVVPIEIFLKVHAPDLHEELIGQREVEDEANSEMKARAEELPSSSKIDKMLEILHETRRTTKNKDKTIVFSQFTTFLNIMETPLREHEFKFVRFDGSMSVARRDEVLQTFYDDPQYTVLLVSTKCGSLGLNLTCANRVILMDVWWNPALENQAIDRVHRIGQRKNVEVHRIFINGTVEDRILELQRKKQALADGALGEGSALKIGRLGLEELLHLFRGTGLSGTRAVASSSRNP